MNPPESFLATATSPVNTSTDQELSASVSDPILSQDAITDKGDIKPRKVDTCMDIPMVEERSPTAITPVPHIPNP
jgi:hypothetical protein